MLPAVQSPLSTQKRASWMPDPGVFNYVRDMMYEDFGVEVGALPGHWIPLGIVGTLDWVFVCGWWIFRNTGVYNSDEPYKYVFDYDGYEFDPDKLQVFREDMSRNKFKERREQPGITGKERTEALPFLREEIFHAWLQGEQDLSPEEADQFIPPPMFLELVMYCTFMWILDTYGRDWIYMQDEILACVYDYGVAYLSNWDGTLLDPSVMKATDRVIGSCRYCGTKLWCVIGTMVGGQWQFVCNNCTVAVAMATGGISERNDRLLHPKCPHLEGVDGRHGDCDATCPHSKMDQEKVWERMEQHGSERVEQYRQKVKELGMNPRQAGGQTLRDITKYFAQLENKEK